MFTRRFAFLVPILIVSLWAFLGARAPEPGLSGAARGVGLSSNIAAGSSKTGWDTVTIFLATDTSTVHFRGEFNQAKAAADIVKELGTDYEFAWDDVNENEPRDLQYYYSAATGNWRIRNSVTTAADSLSVRGIQKHAYVADRRAYLFYAPFENMIPANSQVVYARMRGVAKDIMYYDQADSFSTTLMTLPQDSLWYTSKGTGAGDNNAHAGWARQITGQSDTTGTGSTTLAARGYPADGDGTWSPTLWDRLDFWDYGDWYDWTGFPDGQVAVDSMVTWDITNCVQGAVNGAVNNGLFMYAMDASGSATNHTIHSWDSTGATAKRPWIEIKYLTRRYAAPFPQGKQWAFVFSTDDQWKDANDIYAAVFDSLGGGMTVYVREDNVGTTPGDGYTRASFANLRGYHDLGMEVASHSRTHRETTPTGESLAYGKYGMNYYDGLWGNVGTWTSGIPFADATTTFDSLLVDMDPYWLYEGAASVDGDSLITDPYWGKSFATPGNIYRPEVLKAAEVLGYRAGRSGTASYHQIPDGNREWGLTALYWRPADTDTIWSGLIGHNNNAPRNLIWHSLTYNSDELLGAATVDPTESEVRYNMKRAAAIAVAQKKRVIYMFTHALKGTYQTYGIDADEVRWLAGQAHDSGGWLARSSELGRWLQQNATPIPTPTAYAQDDSFKFEASDEVWYVPYGMDGQFIPRLPNKDLAYSFDSVAPEPPSALQAFAGEGQVVLSWTASPSTEELTYNIYRFFEDSQDTVLVGSNIYATASAVTAINGTEHFYFVSASDLSGNESYDTSVVSATPKDVLNAGSLPYASFWYRNMPNDPLSQAQIDSLAALDAVVSWSYPFNDASDDSAYIDILANVRAENPDFVMLTYIKAHNPLFSWDAAAAGHPTKKIWDYCVAAGGDSSGFARYDNDGGNPYVAEVGYQETPNGFLANISHPALADTIAKYWAEAFDATDADGEYAGVFVDVTDSTLSNSICDGVNCGDVIDYDQDGTPFGSDADEKAAFQTFQIDFLKALRREFAERGMDKRLIVANTTFGRKGADLLTDNDREFMGLLDGYLYEAANYFWPDATGTPSEWSNYLAAPGLLVNAQIDPPLVINHIYADSSGQFMSEPLALAGQTWVNAQIGDDYLGLNTIPTVAARGRLAASGAFVDSTISADGDTITAEYANYTARIVANQTGTELWPYFIVSGTDTLSRGGGWPRQPPAPVIENAEAFDQNILITWSDDPLYGIPEYDRTAVYRSTSSDTTSLALFDYDKQIGEYYNSSVPNDSTYYYALKNTDFFGNESSFSAVVPLTPYVEELNVGSFSIAATVPSDTTAAGNVRPNVTLSYSGGTPFVKPMFRRHDGTYADWADTSAAFWLNPAAADWSGLYDTGVPIATAAEDSGGIDITWDAGTGQTGYLLQMSANGGAWVTVDGSISSGSTSFTHAASDSPPPERGELRYRLYGYNGDPDTTAVATHDSLFYNQAVRVYGKFLALSDTNAAHTGIVETLEQSVLYISYPPPGAPDTTPPDTTGVFAAVAFDTTDTDNVIVTTTGTAAENVQVWHQWKNAYDGTWTPAERWQPMSYAAAISDSIGTLDSTATLDGDTVYVRVKMRDTSENESAFIGANDGNWIAKVFARAVPAADDTVGYGTIGSSSSSIGGSAAYGVRIVADANGSCVSGSVYLTVGGATYNVKAALYDASFNLLANGTLAKSGDGGNGWHTVTFSAPTAITSGTPYILMFQADTSGISAYYDTEGAAVNNIAFVDTPGYASFPDDPMTPVAQYNNRRYSAYVTFE